MNKGGRLFYKCRKCGEIYSDNHAPDVLSALISISIIGRTPHEMGGIVLHMTSLHHCAEKTIGMADLVGGVED